MQSGCVICQERFDAAIGIVSIKCGHVFHSNCISQWLERSNTCPECRNKVCKTSLTKLFFSYSFDNTSDNDFTKSLDGLKEQLHLKDVEIEEKNKKIMEIQSYCALSERNCERLHQEQMELQSKFSAAKRELQKFHQVEAKNQKLLHQNDILQSELEHLNNVKTIVEGCSSDAQKILVDVQANLSSAEVKVAAGRIATYCSVIKRELSRLKQEKTQLQTELMELKCKTGLTKANDKKRIKYLEEQVKMLQDLNSSSLSATCGPSPIPVTPSAPNNHSSHCSDLVNSASVRGAKDSGSSGCVNQVTPITFDFPDKKKQKLNVVILDKDVQKVSTQAAETPVLKFASSVLPTRPKIRCPKNEDSVSRIGYNGLGGHGRVVLGSGVKKGKPQASISKTMLGRKRKQKSISGCW